MMQRRTAAAASSIVAGGRRPTTTTGAALALTVARALGNSNSGSGGGGAVGRKVGVVAPRRLLPAAASLPLGCVYVYMRVCVLGRCLCRQSARSRPRWV